VDRYSRFAKIGGEMISLGSVEEQLDALFGESVGMIAVSVNDVKKGEQIVLLCSSELEVEEIASRIKTSSMIAMMKPSRVFKVEILPKLASGKSDFKGAKKLAEMLMEGSNNADR